MRPLRGGSRLKPGGWVEERLGPGRLGEALLSLRVERTLQQLGLLDLSRVGQQRLIGIKTRGVRDAAGEPAKDQQLKRLDASGNRQCPPQTQDTVRSASADLFELNQQLGHAQRHALKTAGDPTLLGQPDNQPLQQANAVGDQGHVTNKGGNGRCPAAAKDEIKDAGHTAVQVIGGL